jgi:hypothetical protein
MVQLAQTDTKLLRPNRYSTHINIPAQLPLANPNRNRKPLPFLPSNSTLHETPPKTTAAPLSTKARTGAIRVLGLDRTFESAWMLEDKEGWNWE